MLIPEGRPAWLDEVCGDELALRRQVAIYFAYEDDLASFIVDSP